MRTNQRSSPNDLLSIANEYFRYLGRTFPVMCLSDEFYFFPRAEEAASHLNKVESFERDIIVEANRKVGVWLGELEQVREEMDEAGVRLLKQSMAGFLREFETRKVWRDDPTLYLKVSLIGLDQLVSLESQGQELERDWVRERLRSIPKLLASGKKNILRVSLPCREASLEMVQQCMNFLRQSFAPWLEFRYGWDRTLKRDMADAAEAVEDFKGFLPSVLEDPAFAAGEEILALTLKESFGFQGSVADVLDISREEERNAEKVLGKLARQIDPEKNWREIYNGILIKGLRPYNVLDYYRQEVVGLEAFYRQKVLLPLPPPGSVLVEETPLYLQPIRATASYCAPFPAQREAIGRFFVNLGNGSPKRGTHSDLSALHRECRFLTAHETYPGHHVLDWARTNLSNPIRRQVESAFFYEGWACYGEQLTDESGYQPDPCQSLIRVKRELWRAVRSRLDVELHTGTLSFKEGAALMEKLGYSRESALKQARRYALTPGYQLCYTLGKRELLRLRERFVPPLSLEQFHLTVLKGGEIPFDCLERSLEKLTARFIDRTSAPEKPTSA